ncbi:Protein yipf5 [Phytophthora pseudosyringae]|uniref:Protein yipf5 n=1 Tax=Phytophthora pseudosyringae TaxID=221518 RepID=A0A8T1VEN1_9STRA|nr:Protein yipf5 [Phytophthora pseudosyringae]
MHSSSGSSASLTLSFHSDDSNNAGSTFTSSSRTHSRRCGFPECQKTAKRGGLCISHGGGKKCSVEGCATSVVSRGCCVAHGGGKRCQSPDCTKSAQTGGFCWVHGGGKKCGYQGCKKRAQSGGACISHGGGKRCRMEGCSKVVQYDGLCVGHGGYRKCLSHTCNKRALANSYCHAHGGNSVCRIAECWKRAIRGGICSEHKAQTPLGAARTRTSGAFSRCRPSIDLAESPFKVEPTELGRPRLDDQYTTPAPPAAQEHALSPLQFVRQRSSPLVDDGRTMVTPISKHFNAGAHLPQCQNLPVLPSFQTLQRGYRTSPWSDECEMDWSSPTSTPNEGNEDSRNPMMAFPAPRADRVVVSLGRTCARLCSVSSCSRPAKRNGVCLLHSIVAAPSKLDNTM